MRVIRFLCATTSLILFVVLLAHTLHRPAFGWLHFALFAFAVATGNAWAWSVVEGRTQRRCDAINRRMSTVLAAHDLHQVTAAIDDYRNAEKKGGHQ